MAGSGFGSVASLNDILTTLQDEVRATNNLITAVNNLTAQVRATFPQASTITSSASVGALTFSSSQPAAFLTVITSSGATYKVSLYNG